MNKEVFNSIKDDLKWVGILFLLALIIFKIVYFKENLIVLLRYAISLFWLFVLPGYFIMLYWREKLDFTERIVVGTASSAAIIGILSYYIGLMGLNIKYHGILMPIVIIALMMLITTISKKNS
ncbi:MAG: hypothetical protein Q8R04_06625 [Nanoarchaeota archaeon]|nr:hypothetical protein [Nanoarchaeota archaeon]